MYDLATNNVRAAMGMDKRKENRPRGNLSTEENLGAG
jgi:hypothetical protein